MHHLFRFSTIAVMALLCAMSAHAGGGQPIGIDPRVPDRAMVAIQPTSTVDQFIAAFNTLHQQAGDGVSAALLDSIASRRVHLLQINLPPDYSPAQFEALELELESHPAYAPHRVHAELLYEGQAPESKTGSTWVDSVAGSLEYHNQYALQKIGAPAAQDRSTGQGVVVAVLDTGLDSTHPALAGRIVDGGYNFIANNADTSDIGDGVSNDADALVDEAVGHGTFVAGLIAAVAPESRLLPITVLNSDGVGDGWSFVRGIYYAIDRGVEVINMSLGTTYDSLIIYDAIAEARNHGIIVVAAAGNFNRNTEREYPAMWDEEGSSDPLEFVCLGIAATTDTDLKASFSNYHEKLFISAPGATLPSTGLDRSIISALPGGGYEVWEGTSFSVPMVSGTVALVRAQHPEWPATAQTFDTIESLLWTTAINIYPQNPQYQEEMELGAGRLDAAGAVALGPVAPQHGDLNADGAIDVTDLLTVINSWGLVHSSADLDGDGTVNVNDLVLIINNWS